MMTDPIKCKECGDNTCICDDTTEMWAAHCMTCDNQIGERGDGINYCAESKEDAVKLWNELNK